MNRRKFLLLFGGTSATLWLPPSDVLALTPSLAFHVSGACSFCGKDGRDVQGLVGHMGEAQRICNECISLCCDILDYQDVPLEPQAHQLAAAEPLLTREDALALIDEMQRLIDKLSELDLPSPSPLPPPPVQEPMLPMCCSFCRASQEDCNKLIAGPTVYICDGCVADAAGLLPHSLRQP